MSKINVDQLILRMESYLECWKQYNTFMAMAPAYEMSKELPADRKALPIIKVLYRGARILIDAFNRFNIPYQSGIAPSDAIPDPMTTEIFVSHKP